MTKKEIYKLALESARATLRAYFGDQNGFGNDYLQKNTRGKMIVKKVYDKLEPSLLTPEESAQTKGEPLNVPVS